MASPEAETLAKELLKQLKAARISVLLVPQPKLIDGEEWISFYWMRHDQPFAHTTDVPLTDYAGQPPQAAAEAIIRRALEDTDGQSP